MNSSFPEFFVNWLIDYYLVATLLLIILWAGWRWIRQPAHRIAASWMVMAELLLLAAVCALPFWPRVSLVAAGTPKAADFPPEIAKKLRPVTPPKPLDYAKKTRSTIERPEKMEVVQAAVPIAPPKTPWTWPGRLVAGYILGFSIMVLWLCWGAVAAWRICRHANRAEPSLLVELSTVVPPSRRLPQLLVSPRVANAVALGVFRPRIVLPGGLAEQGPSSALRAVLAHEYAHLGRRDLWLLALGRFLLLILFAHPLFWWLRRAIRVEQELLADAFAAGENRQGYAETLLNLIRNSARPSPMAVSAAVGLWEGPSQLSRRIAMLLDETFRIQPTGSRRWKFHALGLLVLFGAACSLVTLKPARSDEESKKPAAPAQSKKDAATSAEEKKSADAQETKQGNFTKIGTGTLTIGRVSGPYTVADDDMKDAIVLPGYPSLMHPKSVAELKLTDEQKKELREIQDTYQAGEQKYYEAMSKNNEKEPLSEEEKFKIWQKRNREQTAAIRKQVEKVLTPEQFAFLDRIEFRKKAAYRAAHPEIMARFGVADLTQEQKDKLLSAQQGMYPAMGKIDSETKAKIVAALSPERQTRLREAVFGPWGTMMQAESLVMLTGEKDGFLVPTIDPYPDFSDPKLRKTLDLSKDQEERMREILKGSPNLLERLATEMKKLPTQEQKRMNIGGGMTKVGSGTLTLTGTNHYVGTTVVTGSGKNLPPEEMKKQEAEALASAKKERESYRAEWEKQPIVKLSIELRKQFEAVLTPEQLAKYKEMAFDRVYYGELFDPLLLHEIGASEQESAEMQQLNKDCEDQHEAVIRDTGEKILNVLTPQQQEKLREGIEREESGNSASMNTSSTNSAFGGTIDISGEAKVDTKSPRGEESKGSAEEQGDDKSAQETTPTGDFHFDGVVVNDAVDFLYLPVYGLLGNEKIEKQIKLSDEQRKKLREISADYERESRKIGEETRTLSSEEMQKKAPQIKQKVVADYRKQVEKVLTTEQLNEYKKAAFPEMALGSLFDPEVIEKIDFKKEQQEKLRQIRQKMEEQMRKESETSTDLILASLTSEQREKLKAGVEREYRENHETPLSERKPEEGGGVGTLTLSDTATLNVAGDIMLWSGPATFRQSETENDPQAEYLALPIYENLGDPATRKTLELSEEQLKALTQMSSKYRTEREKFGREMQQSSPEERPRKERELERESIRMVKEARPEIEKLLTPKQLTALKENIFRSWSGGLLMTAPFQKTLELSDQQKADLGQIRDKAAEKDEQIVREMKDKSLGLLTPEQERKLREELDRRGW